MTFRVSLFAHFRDLAQTDTLVVELPEGATVGDLRRRLATAYPAMAGLLGHSGVAVDGEFAEDGLVLPARAEVAILPPVSGG